MWKQISPDALRGTTDTIEFKEDGFFTIVLPPPEALISIKKSNSDIDISTLNIPTGL